MQVGKCNRHDPYFWYRKPILLYLVKSAKQKEKNKQEKSRKREIRCNSNKSLHVKPFLQRKPLRSLHPHRKETQRGTWLQQPSSPPQTPVARMLKWERGKRAREAEAEERAKKQRKTNDAFLVLSPHHHDDVYPITVENFQALANVWYVDRKSRDRG